MSQLTYPCYITERVYNHFTLKLFVPEFFVLTVILIFYHFFVEPTVKITQIFSCLNTVTWLKIAPPNKKHNHPLFFYVTLGLRPHHPSASPRNRACQLSAAQTHQQCVWHRLSFDLSSFNPGWSLTSFTHVASVPERCGRLGSFQQTGTGLVFSTGVLLASWYFLQH